MSLAKDRFKTIFEVAMATIAYGALWYGFKYIMRSFDGKRIKQDAVNRVMSKSALKGASLNEHEQMLAGEIIWPEDLNISFKDVGGLEEIIDSLRETVIYPLVYPEIFESVSGLLGPPKGVLLYGPPGCGKTMTAKALAKESGATFINLHVSTMTDKWFGESQKLVHALFSLAKKLEPTIIFIDEIDSFLRERRSSDHEATAMMKAEFMTLWDGMTSGDRTRILILGATNRPNDLDKAILRRMPKRFAINLPDTAQRLKVLMIVLKKISLEINFDFQILAQLTEGFSNSDLKELCRNAVMTPVREYSLFNCRAIGKASKGEKGAIRDIDIKSLKVRHVTMKDFNVFIETTISQQDLHCAAFPVD